MKIDEIKLKQQIEDVVDYGAMHGEETDLTTSKIMDILKPLVTAVKELGTREETVPNLTRDAIEKLQAVKRYDLIVIAYINDSGYAGVTREGQIVDRRFFPEAYPVRENSMLGIPKSKKLPNE